MIMGCIVVQSTRGCGGWCLCRRLLLLWAEGNACATVNGHEAREGVVRDFLIRGVLHHEALHLQEAVVSIKLELPCNLHLEWQYSGHDGLLLGLRIRHAVLENEAVKGPAECERRKKATCGTGCVQNHTQRHKDTKTQRDTRHTHTQRHTHTHTLSLSLSLSLCLSLCAYEGGVDFLEKVLRLHPDGNLGRDVAGLLERELLVANVDAKGATHENNVAVPHALEESPALIAATKLVKLHGEIANAVLVWCVPVVQQGVQLGAQKHLHGVLPALVEWLLAATLQSRSGQGKISEKHA